MRKRVLTLVLAALLCTGCGFREDPYRVDTVVRIPMNPTEEAMETEEPKTTEPAQTEMPTEAETEAPTEAPKKPTSGGNKGSGNKGSSNKKEETKPKETEPKETKPQETVPVQTQTPGTEPGETLQPETEPAATQPPETEPEDDLYDISGYTVGALEYAMRDRINAERTENGLVEYSFSTRLSAIASCRANEIAAVWSHTRPDGRHYSTVLADYGYSAGTVTELLVYVTGNGDAETIVSKWLESESHRESLLGGYSTMGIGVYRAGGYTYVCCLLVS